MKLKLYGVMGSISGGTSDLGINTTCLVLSSNDKDLILDSGTGILNYMRSVNESSYHILLSHYHLDHIQGFPFIPQLYDTSNIIKLYGPNFNNNSVKNEVLGFIREPYLPIKREHILADLRSTDLSEGVSYLINGFEVKALKVPHPGGSYIYTIKADGLKMSFLSDFPNGMDLNESVIDFCSNSDLIYTDAMFLEKELKDTTLLEYGHSSVEGAIKFFKKTKSKKLMIGHHNTFRNFDDLKQYESKDIIIAKENEDITI